MCGIGLRRVPLERTVARELEPCTEGTAPLLDDSIKFSEIYNLTGVREIPQR
jgi:hypothetical protein